MVRQERIIPRSHASMKSARDRAMFFWSFLVFHPEIAVKSAVPSEIYSVVSRDQANCPLCSVFRREENGVDTCGSCPLVEHGKKCYEEGGLFYQWYDLETAENGVSENEKVVIRAIRRSRARALLEAIRTWDIHQTEEEV